MALTCIDGKCVVVPDKIPVEELNLELTKEELQIQLDQIQAQINLLEAQK